MAGPTAPRTIGRYSVDRLLGQGGMGRVWLARDTVLGRRVAIKVLRDDLALPPPVRDELIVRMGHEARAAAAVSHPNIVTLYDMGEDAVVGIFLVFEYVTTKGDARDRPDEDASLSLRDRIKHGPLPFTAVAKLARELGSALTFAHEAGVIHRDVKPENILFSRTGFKIADFGIARIPDSTITLANTVLGTPAYTAPEALSTGDFGPASDQFSLAATLYEATTGKRAFHGEDAIVTAGKVSSEPPPPLSESVGPDAVVRALDRALQRGLAKSPENRFASCTELGEEVARIIEAEGATRRASGRPSALSAMLTPVPDLFELERTPLSSRAATVERVMNDPGVISGAVIPGGEQPSLYLRRRTRRFQNIAVGLALVVIVVLILVGRRTPNNEDVAGIGSAAPMITVTPTAPTQTIQPAGPARAHPRPTAIPNPTASQAPSAAASAPPAPPAPSAPVDASAAAPTDAGL